MIFPNTPKRIMVRALNYDYVMPLVEHFDDLAFRCTRKGCSEEQRYSGPVDGLDRYAAQLGWQKTPAGSFCCRTCLAIHNGDDFDLST